MDDEALLKLAEEERKKLPGSFNSGISHFSLIGMEGQLTQCYRQSCYAIMHGKHYMSIPARYLVDLEIRPGVWHAMSKEKQENAIKYTDWLINNSYFANAFLIKDPIETLTVGNIMDGSFPGQYLVMAGKAIRNINETSYFLNNWTEFSKHINKDAALYLAVYFVPLIAPLIGAYNLNWSQGGHYVFPIMTKEGLTRTINHSYALFKTEIPVMTGKGCYFEHSNILHKKKQHARGYKGLLDIKLKPMGAKATVFGTAINNGYLFDGSNIRTALRQVVSDNLISLKEANDAANDAKK